VFDDRDEPRANEVLQQLRRPVSGPSWHCACGEESEPQFGNCWKCGAVRPPE
jgi:hypothetical protein